MLNEQAIAANSSSSPVQPLATRNPYEVLPYEILQYIMELLPVPSQINLKIASGTIGQVLKTTVDELKEIKSQNELSTDHFIKAQRIITRAKKLLRELPAFNEIFDILKLKDFKKLCRGRGAIKIAGHVLLPELDLNNTVHELKFFLGYMFSLFSYVFLLWFVLSFFLMMKKRLFCLD